MNNELIRKYINLLEDGPSDKIAVKIMRALEKGIDRRVIASELCIPQDWVDSLWATQPEENDTYSKQEIAIRKKVDRLAQQKCPPRQIVQMVPGVGIRYATHMWKLLNDDNYMYDDPPEVNE